MIIFTVFLIVLRFSGDDNIAEEIETKGKYKLAISNEKENVDSQVDIRVLKEILGHEQLNTTQIYTHVVDRNIEEAMKKNPLSEIKIKRKFGFSDQED